MLSKIQYLASHILDPVRKKASRGRIKKLYAEKDYLDAYSEHTDIRVEQDPHSAVGGLWEEMGQLQFAFLVKHGLRPHHTMLDIGCGTLRGGRHFIRYLNPGNYTGMDISFLAIEYGKELVSEEGLSDKQPRLIVSENKNLKFEEFAGEKFDYLLAQSVFTHLRREHIEECFEHIGAIMKENSAFFFTFSQADRFIQTSRKNFSYPFSFFESLSLRYGFEAEDHSGDYSHPTGQRMVKLIKK
jgi:SAM-dependent methyltransferase